ncbi:MAG: RidA family protein [Anaerolineae bacterium]
MKQFRNPTSIHRPVAQYTHQIEVSADERILFLSGQVGIDADGQLPDSAGEQLALALDNLMANLHAARMDVLDLTKLTLYLVPSELDAAARRTILSAKLGEHAPCMTLIFVVALATPQILVEIDAFAASS